MCYEGAPRSVLEAYAAGVPVVVSGRGSLPELVEDGVSGLVVRSGDAAAWAEALDKLAEPDAADRLGDGAWRAWRASYSPQRGLTELEGAYERALGALAGR